MVFNMQSVILCVSSKIFLSSLQNADEHVALPTDRKRVCYSDYFPIANQEAILRQFRAFFTNQTIEWWSPLVSKQRATPPDIKRFVVTLNRHFSTLANNNFV